MKWLRVLSLAILAGSPLAAVAAGTAATLYKNPNCGCCDAYVEYLEEHEFEVNVISTPDLAQVKAEHGVPERLGGCHTMLVGSYVFEGLIPVESVRKVLDERPMIRGIALPGMPTGAPGMPGAKRGPLHVYYISAAAEPKIFATY